MDEKWLWQIHTLDDNLFLKSNVMLSKTRAGLDSRFAQRFCPCYNIPYITNARRAERKSFMNKGELIAKIAEAGLSRKDAGVALDAAIAAIGDALAKGESVQLVGFGTFSVKERAAREGRNPRTGETVKIKAAKAPTFKAGKALKEKVN